MAVVLDAATAYDVTPNARAPLSPWALRLQERGHFAAGGRGPEAFDCMGLVLAAQAELGRAVSDYLDLYQALDIRRTGDVDALIRAESAAWQNIDAGAPGDVIVLGSGGRAHHVAVLCGAGRAIHAMDGVGIAIVELIERTRLRRVHGLAVFGLVRPA